MSEALDSSSEDGNSIIYVFTNRLYVLWKTKHEFGRIFGCQAPK